MRVQNFARPHQDVDKKVVNNKTVSFAVNFGCSSSVHEQHWCSALCILHLFSTSLLDKDGDVTRTCMPAELLDLHWQLVKKDPELGERLVPKEKGRIVMLGEYRDKNSSEILGPKIVDGVATRDDWNKCTSKIKLAFKGWLKEEMGWVQPERGALQELKN